MTKSIANFERRSRLRMLRAAIETREAGENFDVVAFVSQDCCWSGYCESRATRHHQDQKSVELTEEDVRRVQQTIIEYYFATFTLKITVGTRYLYRYSLTRILLANAQRFTVMLADTAGNAIDADSPMSVIVPKVKLPNGDDGKDDGDDDSIDHASDSDQDADLKELKQALDPLEKGVEHDKDNDNEEEEVDVDASAVDASADTAGVPIKLPKEARWQKARARFERKFLFVSIRFDSLRFWVRFDSVGFHSISFDSIWGSVHDFGGGGSMHLSFGSIRFD